MLRVSRIIAASSEQVWQVIADPARWPEWGPSVKAAEVAESSLRRGSRGRVKTAVGFWVPFEVREFEKGRYWRWRIGVVPATGHLVEALGNGRSRLTFEVPVLAAPYGIVCALAARRIARICEAEELGSGP
jgi:uncharacterized protein YndB with AHSA1/START domain